MTPNTPLWTSEEVLTATQGRISSGTDAWQASGVSIDSRTCEPGDLFISISGDQFDGHDFVARAIEAGASAAIVSRMPEGLSDEVPLVEVGDTMDALEGLGRAARDRTDASVIGVTGSVGKTGTKDALGLAFGALGKTHTTQGNQNNHIGVPLTLSRLPRDAKFAVIEMGMNHSNEISTLSKLTRPDVAIITTISAVHLEFFDSIADIADAKAEIFDGMCKGATAVLNRDNIYFAILASRAWAHGLERVVGFGAHPESDALLSACTVSDKGSEITAKIGDHVVRYRLQVPGRHWIHNTLAVLASVNALDGDVNTAADAFALLSAPRGRGARIKISRSDGLLTVIDDSYNASPASMRAAIAVLASSHPKHGGRRIAILGDMLELGETAPKLHAALARDLEKSDIDLVFCAGPNMQTLHDALPAAMRGGHAEDSEKLMAEVLDAVHAGDIVMVKGSLGSRMATIVDALAGMDISHSSPQEAQHAV
ncbi:MAG: UDP-N-acetylmuramoylalanyl-D-glutamyl-2,6-diaminopimelate--D-alanyl-D-alanine ligase [Alphaproteobacteria bacterium]|nr:UDP-N-acetylmuramoylalanyl-D-glutamyl-2,6-diaminopimelate--D-alanyl-D-alanine ligase [Alphaproteobacteria bacterium]